MAATPTAAQLDVLRYAAQHEHGLARNYSNNGLAAAGWRRMIARMILAGWMRPSPHGSDEGYITDAGRAVLSKAEAA